MTYIILSEHITKPRYIVTPRVFSNIPMKIVFSADSIFTVMNGKTVYLKDRAMTQYQYSDEDLVALRLKSVLR